MHINYIPPHSDNYIQSLDQQFIILQNIWNKYDATKTDDELPPQACIACFSLPPECDCKSPSYLPISHVLVKLRGMLGREGYEF